MYQSAVRLLSDCFNCSLSLACPLQCSASSAFLRPCTHWQFYPTRTVRERFASGCPCTHCVHCVGFVRYTQTTSGCVRSGRSGRERFASAWLCSVNARVDASGRERRTVSPCLLSDLFILTDTTHMTRKGDICHELSTYNWVTTGREADAVCTWRSGRVHFALGQSFVVWMQTRH